MKIGVIAPTFRDTPRHALDAAARAEEAGLDGVFVFDHLWPIGQPERPALHGPTVLAAIAQETASVAVGTLVARVSLVPPAVLAHQLVSLDRISDGRLIAGVGTGDHLNRAEDEAYGLPWQSKQDRLDRLAEVCAALMAAGVRTWVGGLSDDVRALAAGVHGWNVWGLAPDALRDPPPAVELTWAGQCLIARTPEAAAAKLAERGMRPGLVHGTVEDLRAHLASLRDRGVTWAVYAPLDAGVDPDNAQMLSEAREGLG